MRDLLDAALVAYGNAHAPYSGFRVGAAVRTDGRPDLRRRQCRERSLSGGQLRRGERARGDGRGRRAADRGSPGGRGRRAPVHALRRLPAAPLRVRLAGHAGPSLRSGRPAPDRDPGRAPAPVLLARRTMSQPAAGHGDRRDPGGSAGVPAAGRADPRLRARCARRLRWRMRSRSPMPICRASRARRSRAMTAASCSVGSRVCP